MAFSTGGRGPFSGQMNVTPLIDVLLVLIIMFMVVVSMSKEYVTNPRRKARRTSIGMNAPS